MFRRAHEHKGAAFVEIYQNCNVFNDGAFSAILTKDNRPEMLIDLVHGEPIRFGAEKDKGVRLNKYGEAEIVSIAEVGEDAVLVHDEHRADPTVAFALSAWPTTRSCRRPSACSVRSRVRATSPRCSSSSRRPRSSAVPATSPASSAAPASGKSPSRALRAGMAGNQAVLCTLR